MNSKEKRNIKTRTFFTILLVIYFAFLVFLMLLSREPMEERECNLEVFSTVKYFWRLLDGPYKDVAIINLAGNVIMFMPLGMLLPGIWKAQKNFFVMLFTSAFVICTLEAIQYYTKLGTADIDDLILNLVGASIGYLIFLILFNNQRS